MSVNEIEYSCYRHKNKKTERYSDLDSALSEAYADIQFNTGYPLSIAVDGRVIYNHNRIIEKYDNDQKNVE